MARDCGHARIKADVAAMARASSMTARRVHGTVVTAVWLLALARSATAWASLPACFPERTIGASSPLFNEEGFIIGGVAVGEVVRVLEQGVGPSHQLARVELARPSHFVALVSWRRLVVFPRQEVELVPGFAWGLEGFPLVTEGPGDSDALVYNFGLAAQKRWLPPAVVDCRMLSGTPVVETVSQQHDCGCRPRVIVAKHESKGKVFEIRDGVRLKQADGSFSFRVPFQTAEFVARDGDWVQLEKIDDFQGLRVRGWVSSHDAWPMRSSVYGVGRGGGSVCSLLVRKVEPEPDRIELVADVDLADSPGATVRVRIPKGTSILVGARDGAWARVFVLVTAKARPKQRRRAGRRTLQGEPPRLIVLGWIPVEGLESR